MFDLDEDKTPEYMTVRKFLDLPDIFERITSSFSEDRVYGLYQSSTVRSIIEATLVAYEQAEQEAAEKVAEAERLAFAAMEVGDGECNGDDYDYDYDYDCDDGMVDDCEVETIFGRRMKMVDKDFQAIRRRLKIIEYDLGLTSSRKAMLENRMIEDEGLPDGEVDEEEDDDGDDDGDDVPRGYEG